MRKFDTLDKRISVIRQIIEEENELVLEKSVKEIAEIINKEEDLFINSSDLELGDGIDIIFYEQVSGYDEQKMIDRILKSISLSEYNKFEIVIFVHTIEEKIKVNENVREEVEKFFKLKRKSKKIWKFNVRFVGSEGSKGINVTIDSAIRILEYTHIDPPAEGQVYNANLYDLVKMYNIVGDSLFKDNVREKIEDVLDVDAEIQRTLEGEPENFWFFNNGITLMLDSDIISQRREFQLDIEISNTADLSVINGAQTISVAALYFFKLMNNIEKNKDNELDEKLKRAKEAKVLLRIIKKEKSQKNVKFYQDISISLNRQKAINDADIRYTEYLIDDINNLSEGRQNPYFFIDKREDKNRKKISRHYSMERFVKISAIYLLQEPGSARSGKGKYIKQDTQWNRLNISEKGEVDEKLFLKKYGPFTIVDKLFSKVNEKMGLAAKNHANQEIRNIFKYSSEFLCAYIVWVANGKNNDDFSCFPQKNNMEDEILMIIINEFAKATMSCFFKEEIDSNLFKKDKKYIELREYLDKNEILQSAIMKLFIY